LNFQNSKGIPLVILVAWQYEEAESVYKKKKKRNITADSIDKVGLVTKYALELSLAHQ
jgi:hypothetical protein